jgi:hypothetical protein
VVDVASKPTRAMARITPRAPPNRRMNLSMAPERYQMPVAADPSPRGTSGLERQLE